MLDTLDWPVWCQLPLIIITTLLSTIALSAFQIACKSLLKGWANEDLNNDALKTIAENKILTAQIKSKLEAIKS